MPAPKRPERYKAGDPLDPDLLRQPKGVYVYKGSPLEALTKLTLSRIGVGIFPIKDLEIVAASLGLLGFTPDDHFGTSVVSAGSDGKRGELQRHDDHSVIVSRTQRGTGFANFYWPVADDNGLNPDFVFDPRRDAVHLTAKHVPVNSSTIVVFPANTWYAFDTDPNKTRASTFRHYHNPEA